MTNIVIISSVLVTNWAGWVTFNTDGKTNENPFIVTGAVVEQGAVHRSTLLGMKADGGTVPIGRLWMFEGDIWRTNNVPGKIHKPKK